MKNYYRQKGCTPGTPMSIFLIIVTIIVILFAIFMNRKAKADEIKDTSWYNAHCEKYNPDLIWNFKYFEDSIIVEKPEEIIITFSNGDKIPLKGWLTDNNNCKSSKISNFKAVYLGESSATWLYEKVGDKICPKSDSVQRYLTFVSVANMPRKQLSKMTLDDWKKTNTDRKSYLINDNAFNNGIFGRVFKNAQEGDIFNISVERKNIKEIKREIDGTPKYECHYVLYLLDAKPIIK